MPCTVCRAQAEDSHRARVVLRRLRLLRQQGLADRGALLKAAADAADAYRQTRAAWDAAKAARRLEIEAEKKQQQQQAQAEAKAARGEGAEGKPAGAAALAAGGELPEKRKPLVAPDLEGMWQRMRDTKRLARELTPEVLMRRLWIPLFQFPGMHTDLFVSRCREDDVYEVD